MIKITRKVKDLTNKKFGHLTVVKMNEERGPSNKVMCTCKCDCGNTIVVMSNSLTTGKTVSCGCRIQKKTHGMKNTRIYRIWAGMKNRCTNVNNQSYSDYGGRGITLCEEWNKFENFYKWSKESGYSDNLTIDRINVNGNYEPNNCRWATYEQQNNNKRNNIYIKYNNEVVTLTELSRMTNICPESLRKRYNDEDEDNEELIEYVTSKLKGDSNKKDGKKKKK